MSVFCANNKINAISENEIQKLCKVHLACVSEVSVSAVRNQSEGKLILFLFFFFVSFAPNTQSLHAHPMCWIT